MWNQIKTSFLQKKKKLGRAVFVLPESFFEIGLLFDFVEKE